VLYWSQSQPQVLAAQFERIVTLAQLKAVNITVLFLGEPVDVVPWNNFVIYEGDEPFVSMKLVHRSETLIGPHHIDFYRRLYDQSWQRADTGSEATALISASPRRSEDSAHG
jgi:hypothetical protein